MNKRVKALEQTLSELNASHEYLKEDHEELGKAHSKLEKAHSLLLEQHAKKEIVVSCNVGITCDIIEESFYQPIIVLATRPVPWGRAGSATAGGPWH